MRAGTAPAAACRAGGRSGLRRRQKSPIGHASAAARNGDGSCNLTMRAAWAAAEAAAVAAAPWRAASFFDAAAAEGLSVCPCGAAGLPSSVGASRFPAVALSVAGERAPAAVAPRRERARDAEVANSSWKIKVIPGAPAVETFYDGEVEPVDLHLLVHLMYAVPQAWRPHCADTLPYRFAFSYDHGAVPGKPEQHAIQLLADAAVVFGGASLRAALIASGECQLSCMEYPPVLLRLPAIRPFTTRLARSWEWAMSEFLVCPAYRRTKGAVAEAARRRLAARRKRERQTAEAAAAASLAQRPLPPTTSRPAHQPSSTPTVQSDAPGLPAAPTSAAAFFPFGPQLELPALPKKASRLMHDLLELGMAQPLAAFDAAPVPAALLPLLAALQAAAKAPGAQGVPPVLPPVAPEPCSQDRMQVWLCSFTSAVGHFMKVPLAFASRTAEGGTDAPPPAGLELLSFDCRKPAKIVREMPATHAAVRALGALFAWGWQLLLDEMRQKVPAAAGAGGGDAGGSAGGAAVVVGNPDAATAATGDAAVNSPISEHSLPSLATSQDRQPAPGTVPVRPVEEASLSREVVFCPWRSLALPHLWNAGLAQWLVPDVLNVLRTCWLALAHKLLAAYRDPWTLERVAPLEWLEAESGGISWRHLRCDAAEARKRSAQVAAAAARIVAKSGEAGGETGGKTGGEAGGETGGEAGGETGSEAGGEGGNEAGGETGGGAGGEAGAGAGNEAGRTAAARTGAAGPGCSAVGEPRVASAGSPRPSPQSAPAPAKRPRMGSLSASPTAGRPPLAPELPAGLLPQPWADLLARLAVAKKSIHCAPARPAAPRKLLPAPPAPPPARAKLQPLVLAVPSTRPAVVIERPEAAGAGAAAPGRPLPAPGGRNPATSKPAPASPTAVRRPAHEDWAHEDWPLVFDPLLPGAPEPVFSRADEPLFGALDAELGEELFPNEDPLGCCPLRGGGRGLASAASVGSARGFGGPVLSRRSGGEFSNSASGHSTGSSPAFAADAFEGNSRLGDSSGEVSGGGGSVVADAAALGSSTLFNVVSPANRLSATEPASPDEILPQKPSPRSTASPDGRISGSTSPLSDEALLSLVMDPDLVQAVASAMGVSPASAAP